MVLQQWIPRIETYSHTKHTTTKASRTRDQDTCSLRPATLTQVSQLEGGDRRIYEAKITTQVQAQTHAHTQQTAREKKSLAAIAIENCDNYLLNLVFSEVVPQQRSFGRRHPRTPKAKVPVWHLPRVRGNREVPEQPAVVLLVIHVRGTHTVKRLRCRCFVVVAPADWFIQYTDSIWWIRSRKKKKGRRNAQAVRPGRWSVDRMVIS